MSATVMLRPQPSFDGARGGAHPAKSDNPAGNRLQIQIAGSEAHQIRACTDRPARRISGQPAGASAVAEGLQHRQVEEPASGCPVRRRVDGTLLLALRSTSGALKREVAVSPATPK